GSSSRCHACDQIGDISTQLFYTSCDRHYCNGHYCLMLEANVVVRWKCPDCKVCQTCSKLHPDNVHDAKTLT
ncbi:unnamed protein product, partial [Didymodactylos carnosus]